MIITLGLSCPASLCVSVSLSLPISLSLSISLSHSLTAYGQHDLDSRLAGVYRVQVLEERRHAAKLLLEQSTRQFGAGHAAVKRCDADHELSLSLSLMRKLACLPVRGHGSGSEWSFHFGLSFWQRMVQYSAPVALQCTNTLYCQRCKLTAQRGSTAHKAREAAEDERDQRQFGSDPDPVEKTVIPSWP